jgi:hypothetical protein
MMGAHNSAEDRDISRLGLGAKEEQPGDVALAIHGAAIRNY